MYKQRRQSLQNGYTLIELLIVSTIVVLLLLSASSIFMTTLLSGARTNVTRQIKAEGNEMISQIEFALRNARSVNLPAGTSISCSPSGSANTLTGTGVDITDVNGNTIHLALDSTKITLGGQPINSSFVVSNSPNPPLLTCYQDSATKKTSVKVEFTLSRTETSSQLREDFSAFVQLRNS